MLSKNAHSGFYTLFFLVSCTSLLLGGGPSLDPILWGLDLPVENLSRSTQFYTQVMGFQQQNQHHEQRVVLANGKLQILLRQVNGTEASSRSGAYVNYKVSDLNAAVKRCLANGARLGGSFPIPSQVGLSAEMRDPDGNLFHLVNLKPEFGTVETAIAVFNIGLHLPDMEEAETFYSSLGFKVYSHDYLPKSLPFLPAGPLSLVMHPTPKSEFGLQSGSNLVLTYSHSEEAESWFKEKNQLHPWPFRKVDSDGFQGIIYDPGGNGIALKAPKPPSSGKRSP